jgi:hypothetical protein
MMMLSVCSLLSGREVVTVRPPVYTRFKFQLVLPTIRTLWAQRQNNHRYWRRLRVCTGIVAKFASEGCMVVALDVNAVLASQSVARLPSLSAIGIRKDVSESRLGRALDTS